jgi:hypothetical protein
MRRKFWAASVALTLAAVTVAADTAADIDYSDFDDTLMRDMDDAIKDLDSNVSGQEADASLANIKLLLEGLAQAEKYFAAKPQTPRGAGLAREGQEHLALVAKALEAKDFDTASTHVRDVVRSCKACHEAYKPPE